MSWSPARLRPYLVEPDYYRLGYQLSAQLLNREHVRQTTGRQEAYGVAAEVLVSARKMRCWYRERRDEPWWKPWIRLSRKDKRLMRFLEFTVEPCLELIIAASLPEARRKHQVSIADLRAKAKDGHLSYRALYSLACHEAEDPKETELALAYLRLAFRLAPADRRQRLVKWAGKDPSLGSIRKEPEFTLLLKTFGVS